MADPRSRLRRLAGRIERVDLADYPKGPVRRRAARLYAIARMVEETVGLDPKSTPRRLTTLLGAADRQVSRLERDRAKQAPLSLAERLARRERSG
jgi:uncharacterized protein (DUF2236 family)